MLSSTDIPASAFVSWNVRTIPWRAIRYDAHPATSTPSKRQLPSSARSKPVRTLKRVVLPAPFGPISAVIVCGMTRRSSTDTATSPPKRRTTCSTSRIASFDGAASLTEHHLAPRAEYALRSEDHEQHDHESDQHEPDGPDLGRVDDTPQTEEVVKDRLAHEALRRDDKEPERHRAHDRPEDARGAAEDQRREDEERYRRLERLRLDELPVDGEHDARETAHHAAEHERLHLVGEHVL